MKAIEHCARAVIQYLNGDFRLFEKYRDMAIRFYEEEKNIATIGEMLSDRTKEKLYDMVS